MSVWEDFLGKVKKGLLKYPRRVTCPLAVAFAISGAVLLTVSLYGVGMSSLFSSSKYSFDGMHPALAALVAIAGFLLQALAFIIAIGILGTLDEDEKKKKRTRTEKKTREQLSFQLYWCDHVLYPVLRGYVPSKNRADHGVVAFADEKLSCGRKVVRHADNLFKDLPDFEDYDNPEFREWRHKVAETRQDVENLVTIWESVLGGARLDVRDTAETYKTLGDNLGVGAMIDAWQKGLPFADVTGRPEAELKD